MPQMPAALLSVFILQACEGVGIVATDDPERKLAQADHLVVEEGRLMQARRITEQAIAIFTERNDKAGLARAYRQYAIVAEAGGLGSDAILRRDPRVALTARPEDLDLSDHYLAMALELATETKQLHLAANIVYIQGNNQLLRGTPLNSCAYYDRALQRYRDAEKERPAQELLGPPPAVFLADAKKKAGCR
jgi:hypothetical protein